MPAEPVRLELRYELPAPPARVWPILADTERLNRQVGLPPTLAVPLGTEPVRRARVRARLHGLPMEWDEDPFEFVEGQYYWEQREIHRGPIREFSGGVTLAPSGTGGTVVSAVSSFRPAGLAGNALLRLLLLKVRRDFDTLIAGVRAHLEGRAAHPYGAGVDFTPDSRREQTLARLRAAAAPLAGDPLANRLLEHLAAAGDTALVRIRPFALARAWGVERLAVLRLCLRAARDGILDLSWDLLCPNCAGARARWPRLDALRGRAHCADCQITFDADFDRAVEVTFRPNPRFRSVDGLIYCSGGPRNTPHVVAQKVLAPGESWEPVPELAPGRYRLRNLTGSLAAPLTVEEDPRLPRHAVAVLQPDGVQLSPPQGPLGAGPVHCRLANETETRQQVILERFGVWEDVATAATVSVFQEFRDLFGREVLAPDVQLGIQTLPLLFTDLQGSTTLYSRLGDAAAYSLVRDHFELLRTLVARHGGGVIKTIGDAVMAAFPTGPAAVAAALEIHADLARFNGPGGPGERSPLRLKVGLHQGPCIAVRTFDDRLDYFGGTVNLAARTHEQSRGDDVVISPQFLADPECAALLAGVRRESFEADLRGLGRHVLYRLYPGAGGQEAGASSV